MRLRKEIRTAIHILMLIALAAAAIWLFVMCVLYGSYKYSPATPEEIAQMNTIERWFFGR